MIADALRTPAGHGALTGLPGATPLVARRRAMADATLDLATRRQAARWLLFSGQPCDKAAAQKFLAGVQP